MPAATTRRTRLNHQIFGGHKPVFYKRPKVQITSGIILLLTIWLTWQYRVELFSTPEDRYQSAYDAGDLNSAVDLARKMLDEAPDSEAAKKALAASLVERAALGQSEDGAADVKEALKIALEIAKKSGGDADAERIAGFALTLLGQNDEAVLHYKKAVDLAPAVASNHVSLGQALELADKTAAAENSYVRALKLDGTNGDALVSMSRIRLQEKNYAAVYTLTSQALRDSNQAIVAEAHRIRALSLSAEGKSVEAIGEAETAVALINDSVPLLLTLGEVKYNAVFSSNTGDILKKAEEILKIAEEAISLSPNSAEANFLAYRAATLGGKTVDAKRYAAVTLSTIETDKTISEQKKEYIKLFVSRSLEAKITIGEGSVSPAP